MRNGVTTWAFEHSKQNSSVAAFMIYRHHRYIGRALGKNRQIIASGKNLLQFNRIRSFSYFGDDIAA